MTLPEGNSLGKSRTIQVSRVMSIMDYIAHRQKIPVSINDDTIEKGEGKALLIAELSPTNVELLLINDKILKIIISGLQCNNSS